MLKILVAGDAFMKSDVIKRHLVEKLSNLKEKVNVQTIEWVTREYQKSQIKGVKGKIEEFAGDPADLVKHMDGVDALVVHVAPVTADVLDASDRLKIVACTRGGAVNIDINAATERKIPVLFTPGRNAEAVADYTFGLLLSETRNIARSNEELKKGIWRYEWYDYEMCGYELTGKTFGIIGFGQVGRKVGTRAKAFGMKILVYDPYVPDREIVECGYKPVKLEMLLRNSDFVSLHARLSKDTEKMIGLKELSMMKKTAYLINTARGKLVDEKALLQALESKLIAGAALDVIETEPIGKGHPILLMDNVTITPHIGGATKDVVDRAAQMIAEDIERILNGEKPKYCANPSVLKT